MFRVLLASLLLVSAAACSDDTSDAANNGTNNGTNNGANNGANNGTNNGSNNGNNGTNNGNNGANNGNNGTNNGNNGTNNGNNGANNGNNGANNGNNGVPQGPCNIVPCGGDPVGVWVWDDYCTAPQEDTVLDCGEALVLFEIVPTGTLTLAEDGSANVDAEYLLIDTAVIPSSCLGELDCGGVADALSGEDEDWACEQGRGGCDCVQERVLDGSSQGTWEATEDPNVIIYDAEEDEPRRLQFCQDGDTLEFQDVGDPGQSSFTFVRQ